MKTKKLLKIIMIMLLLIHILSIKSFANNEIDTSTEELENKLEIQYSSHIQDYGWEEEFSKTNGQTSGTVGKNKKIEATKIKLINNADGSGVNYSLYVEGQGWQKTASNGEISGTEGKNLKIFGLKVNLINIEEYSVMYRIHVEDIGWKEWCHDGQKTSSIDEQKKVEAIEIKLVPKIKEELSISYSTHVQDYGWENEFSKINGQTSGTTGKNKKIEAVKIRMNGNPQNTGIRYRAYVEDYGWQAWQEDGDTIGTTGKNLKMLGLKIELVNMDTYSVQYRVHVEDYGWLDWSVDGQTTGKISYGKKIEAIEIKITGKTTTYPKAVTYTSYIENHGWQEEYLNENGEISGTTGKNLKLLGIKVKLQNYDSNSKILYRVHVEDYGWLDWASDGIETGKITQGKKIEAIEIKLENMEEYTVEYRTHVQDYGWQEWKIDGETSGTTGKNKKVEAIQIRIVPKYKRHYVGIDVSSHNGTIDWAQVKKTGIDFAIIRAGYRGYGTEGNLREDIKFKENIQGATDNGIKVGVYFYSQAITKEEAIEEAEMTLNLIKKYGFSNKIKYPIVIDTEQSSGRGDSMSKSQRTEIVKTFCNVIEQAGYKPMIYSNKYWLQKDLDINQLKQYDVWLAHYTNTDDPLNNPSDYKGDYEIWQYTSKGTLAGIDGYVDKNIGYKEY